MTTQDELTQEKTTIKSKAAALRARLAEVDKELAELSTNAASEKRSLVDKVLGRQKWDPAQLAARDTRAEVLRAARVELVMQIDAAASGMPVIELALRRGHFGEQYTRGKVLAGEIRDDMLALAAKYGQLCEIINEIVDEQENGRSGPFSDAPALRVPEAWNIRDAGFILRGAALAREIAEEWHVGNGIFLLAAWKPGEN